MCVSHILHFSLFLAIFQVVQCVFSFCMFLSVSCHISCPTMVFFHFPRFSFFLPYSRSYSVHFSFFTFSSFNIFQVIECLCLIFHVFQFAHQNPGPTLCIFYSSRFTLFLAVFQVLHCVFLILHDFQCFLPYFMSNLVVSCQFSHHSPGSRVCVSHFTRFSVL